MKLAVCLLMFLMLAGCASKQPSSSPIQKERVELDSGDAEARSLSEKLLDIFTEAEDR